MIKIATFFQLSKYPGCYTRGTCGRDNRDLTSIAGTNDTTIIFNHSILVKHISGISLAGVYSLVRKSIVYAAGAVTRDISNVVQPLRPGLKPILRTSRPKVGKSGPNGLIPDADSKNCIGNRRCMAG
jgi:hypothetical protein